MITWQIEKRKIEDLKGYDKNPRKFTKKGLKDLKASLENLGDANIITINADNTVLGGHARLTVMKQLGYTEVDVKVPNRQLDEQEVKEIVIRLNANTAGEWDLDKLQADFDLNDLTEWGLDIEFPELDEQEVKEIEVPEEVETRCKPGDIWKLGNHRLMCGNSTSITDVEKLMNGVKADMVFTDPPYGMNLDTDYSKMPSVVKEGNKTYKKVLGDNEDFTPELITTTLNAFNYCNELFMFGADYFAELLPNKNDGCWFVWDKRVEEQFDKMFGSSFELCWSKSKHKREIIRYNNTLFSGEQDAKNKVHPTQKPLKVVSWFLEKFSNIDNIVVDTFGGSGSTLIACEQLNRKCFMMELDPHYCDVILQRYINFKGSDADVFLLKDGKKIPYSEAHS